MPRTITCHMLAGYETPEVRNVTLPQKVEHYEGEPLLDVVFYYGQNDFAVGPEKNKKYSVSAGDVIEVNGELWLVAWLGFKKLTAEQYESYKALSRRDRHNWRMDFELTADQAEQS